MGQFLMEIRRQPGSALGGNQHGEQQLKNHGVCLSLTEIFVADEIFISVLRKRPTYFVDTSIEQRTFSTIVTFD
jgi:hypothetical protein